MKILIFSAYFYPHRGGLEQFCYEVAKRLSQNGHEVTVVSSRFNQEKSREIVDGFKIIRLDQVDFIGAWPIVKWNKNNREIFRQLEKENFDWAINNTRFFAISLMGGIFAKRRKIPLLHIEHGTCHPQLENRFVRELARWYDLTLGKIAVRMATKVVGVSRAAAEFCQSLGMKQVGLFYNSVDTSFFGKDEKIKKADNLSVIFVGRIIQGKGIQDLIVAFKKIKSRRVDLKIVGSGSYLDSLKELAKGDKRIKFLGEKKKDEVRELLGDADIFVNPSYSEGLPTSVLEAGAMGLAVIATDVGGTGEIIEHEKNGLLCQMKDVDQSSKYLQDLIEDERLRLKLGRALRKKIEAEFGWDKSVEKLVDILQGKDV